MHLNDELLPPPPSVYSIAASHSNPTLSTTVMMSRTVAFAPSVAFGGHLKTCTSQQLTFRGREPLFASVAHRRMPARMATGSPEKASKPATQPETLLPPPSPSLLRSFASVMTNLFPVVVALASVVALSRPALFTGLASPLLIQSMLAVLMLSTGLTLSPSDLMRALRRPKPVLFSFLSCYLALPALALGLAHLFSLDVTTRAGLLLLSIISGGQASNLCTQIAGGDTALSVTMTAVTTLAATVMLPLLSSALLGTVVSVDRVQLAATTARVTLFPIAAGVAANHFFPETLKKLRPVLPVLGIISVVVLVLGPVAQTAPVFASSWSTLLAPVLLLHILGFIFGYSGPAILGGGWKLAVTTAFESAFKSPVLSFVLAKKFFPPGVELASAVSIVVLAPITAVFAIILRQINLSRQRKSQ